MFNDSAFEGLIVHGRDVRGAMVLWRPTPIGCEYHPSHASVFGGFDLFKSIGKGFKKAGKWIGNAVHAVGRAIGKAIKWVAKGVQQLGKLLSKIPIIGGLLKGILQIWTAPITFANAIARGTRLDKALLKTFRSVMGGFAEGMKWATTIISVIPGIGPVCSAVLGTAVSLAQGQPITEALKNGLLSAIPGGPLAKAAFETGIAVFQGKNPEQIGLAAVGALAGVVGVPIPDGIKKTMATGIDMTHKLANGQVISPDFLKNVSGQLPSVMGKANAEKLLQQASGRGVTQAVQIASQTKIANALASSYTRVKGMTEESRSALDKGLKIGMTVGHAENLQKKLAKGLTDKSHLDTLASDGRGFAVRTARQGANVLRQHGKAKVLKSPTAVNTVAKDAALYEARKLVRPDMVRGFDIATGISKNQCGQYAVTAIRAALSPQEKQGFDMAMSFHIGRVALKQPPPKKGESIATVAKKQIGFHTTMGMMGAPEENRIELAKTLAMNPYAKDGVVQAIVSVADERSESVWTKILKALGLLDDKPAVIPDDQPQALAAAGEVWGNFSYPGQEGQENGRQEPYSGAPQFDFPDEFGDEEDDIMGNFCYPGQKGQSNGRQEPYSGKSQFQLPPRFG
jgi:hypothetical protein